MRHPKPCEGNGAAIALPVRNLPVASLRRGVPIHLSIRSPSFPSSLSLHLALRFSAAKTIFAPSPPLPCVIASFCDGVMGDADDRQPPINRLDGRDLERA